VVLAFSLCLTSQIRAQTLQTSTSELPSFDVASIKQNKSGEFFGRFGYEPGGQLVVVNNAVRALIRSAYGLQNYQILGGPEWMSADRYDVSAKATGNFAERHTVPRRGRSASWRKAGGHYVTS
jgi:hypothetical protein